MEKFDNQLLLSVQQTRYPKAEARHPQMPSVLCTAVRCGKLSNSAADRNISSQAIISTGRGD